MVEEDRGLRPPSGAESEHDHVENSDASTSLSWWDGWRGVRAHRQQRSCRRGDRRRRAHRGMAWRRSADIAAGGTDVVVVVNEQRALLRTDDTAAMLAPDRPRPVRRAAFPDRCLRRRHRRAARADLGRRPGRVAGLHPVVAVYSTFLNRAFDQLLMDVALHRQAGHRWCWTGPASPATDGAVAQRHVGPVDPAPSCPASGSPPPATSRAAARGAAPRPSQVDRRAHRPPLPQGRR